MEYCINSTLILQQECFNAPVTEVYYGRVLVMMKICSLCLCVCIIVYVVG